MRILLTTTRVLGVALASCFLLFTSTMFIANLRDYGFTGHFVGSYFLPVYLPYFALLILLLLPFTRIRNVSVWRGLFVAMIVLALVWLIPVAYRSIAHPTVHVTKPPGEGVPDHILITHSYDELHTVLLILAFLVTQILAIWFLRQRALRPVL